MRARAFSRDTVIREPSLVLFARRLGRWTMTMRMRWTIQRRIHHHDALRRSKTRTPLRDRGWLMVLVVVLSDGTIFAARRAGPEDWWASDKMTVDVGVTRRRRKRRQRMILTGRRRRMQMRMRMRTSVVGTGTSERGGWRRHRWRYRRLGARGHHSDIGRWHGTWQRSSARQGAGASSRHVSTHYMTCRTHGWRIVRSAGWIDGGWCRTWISVVAHVASTAIVHLHAVEAHVVGRRRARIADVTRLWHYNIRWQLFLRGDTKSYIDVRYCWRDNNENSADSIYAVMIYDIAIRQISYLEFQYFSSYYPLVL